MRMRHCLIKYAIISIYIPEQKYEHCIKPGSEFLFDFFDILKSKVTEYIFGYLLCYKSENTVNIQKKITICLGIKSYINQANDIPFVKTFTI